MAGPPVAGSPRRSKKLVRGQVDGCPDDAPILTFIRAVDAHFGIRSHLDCASTDANIPLSLGLPAISIGAGGQGGGAHTPQEWFHPEGREFGLRRIILALCLLSQDVEAKRFRPRPKDRLVTG